MTSKALWLLYFILGCSFSSGAGPLTYAGKSIQSLIKDAYGSVGSTPSQNKSPLKGGSSSSSIRADHNEDQSPGDLQRAKMVSAHLLSLDKKKKVKDAVENHTGLRKQPVQHVKGLAAESHGEGLRPAPYFSQTNRMSTDRLQLEAANSISAYFRPPVYTHPKGRLLEGEHTFQSTQSAIGKHPGWLDHLNRSGRKDLLEKLSNITMPSWLTNRQTSSLLYHFSALKKDADNREVCLTDCRREHEEVEAYCTSDFVVNGIVHDIHMMHKGLRLVTLLVNSHGLYKTNRLYITPDGFFFRVHVLVVDALSCSKPCPDIRLGSRYIVMGHVYHRRQQLPAVLQEYVRGHLRPGDGLLWSGSSYVKRFNRRRDRKVQEAARTKCR